MENIKTNNSSEKFINKRSIIRNIIYVASAILSIAVFMSAKPFLTNTPINEAHLDSSEKVEYNIEDFILSEEEIAEFGNENPYIDNSIEGKVETSNSEKENIILEKIKEENIFQTKSNKPEGLYIMVGSFSVYQNAINLQSKNPTQLKCYIFDTDENNLNRVGLFVSNTDLNKAKMVLSKVKMMQPKSWIMYNISKNN